MSEGSVGALLRHAMRSSSVEGSPGLCRDFRITVGLREGWDAEGRVYDVSEAVRTARAWMSRRSVPAGRRFPACSPAPR